MDWVAHVRRPYIEHYDVGYEPAPGPCTWPVPHHTHRAGGQWLPPLPHFCVWWCLNAQVCEHVGLSDALHCGSRSWAWISPLPLGSLCGFSLFSVRMLLCKMLVPSTRFGLALVPHNTRVFWRITQPIRGTSLVQYSSMARHRCKSIIVLKTSLNNLTTPPGSPVPYLTVFPAITNLLISSFRLFCCL